MTSRLAAMALALSAFAAPGLARADGFDFVPSNPFKFEPVQTQRPNAIMVFGGGMSTSNIGEALLANLLVDKKLYPYPSYDNSIVGLAYDRDFYDLGLGLRLGGEAGVADRFGYYARCCDVIVKSNAMLSSGEFWAGPQLRYTGVDLFNLVHMGAGVTFGLSAVTNSIGREEDRVIGWHGNAHLLYYLGPELDFSAPSLPGFELVLKVQHRSGGRMVPVLPPLGHLYEGYNADVVGLRYRF